MRFIIVWFSVFAVACTKIEKIYVLPNREDIVSTIYEKIMTDGTLSTDGLNDSKAYFIDYSSSSLSKMLFPDTVEYRLSNIKMGRKISQVVDTAIIYDIKYYLRGYLKIVQGSFFVSYLTQIHIDTTDLCIDYKAHIWMIPFQVP